MSNMEYKRLSDCAAWGKDRTHDINYDSYISTENMIKDKGGVTIASSIPDSKTASAYRPNDILLSNIRPYFRKIWYADKNGSCSNDVLVVRANEDVDSKFLYYVLSDNNFFNYDTVTSKGTKMPRGTQTAIMKYLVPDINVGKQRKIANILSSYDNLIENNNKRIKLLEQMAGNLYKEWFVRFRFPGYEDVELEKGLPKDWEILKANQLFDITIGKTPDRKIFEYFSNSPECNYPWISISDMRSASTFVFKTKEYLTFDAVNTCNVKIIPKNTVIVSFKLTVGQVAITTSDMCTNEAIAHFTTDNAAMREYIYLYLKNFQYSDLGNTSSIGTAVNSKIIKNMKIVVPSSELLNRFHDSANSIFEEIRLLNETNNILIQQRDMLLPRLMSGKLEV